MVTALYWFSRWPWVVAFLSIFVFGTLLPQFAWYLRTPVVIGGALVVLVILIVIRQGVRTRLMEQAIIDGSITYEPGTNEWKQR